MIELAALAILGAVCLALVHVLRVERRQAARERDLLTNQLLHAARKPWQPAPAVAWPVQITTASTPSSGDDGPELLDGDTLIGV